MCPRVEEVVRQIHILGADKAPEQVDVFPPLTHDSSSSTGQAQLKKNVLPAKENSAIRRKTGLSSFVKAAVCAYTDLGVNIRKERKKGRLVAEGTGFQECRAFQGKKLVNLSASCAAYPLGTMVHPHENHHPSRLFAFMVYHPLCTA